MKTDTEKTAYLCNMIVAGVMSKDKDSTRSHLEDLSLFLSEKGLVE